MVLRRITVDNSVRYIPKGEQSKEKDTNPNTIRNNSNPRKKTTKFHKITKSFLEIFQH